MGSVDGSAGQDAATLDREGAVAVITFNRPHALNAVDASLSAAVGAALEEVDGDSSLQVAVITGAGRAFCAGADLKALGAGRDLTAPGHPEWGFAGLVEHQVRKPLIAAVNGLALGGGTEIVLACDLAVLNEETSLGLPEVRRGLFAGAGGLIHLPQQLPLKVAMYLALTGEPLPAAEALQYGLVNAIAPQEEVVARAVEMADRIARNAPLALRATKRMVRRATGHGASWNRDLWRLQAEEMAELLRSNDAQEGTTAFAEKREPMWSGT
jgi:crotonobetainyl-CoA hydratase